MSSVIMTTCMCSMHVDTSSNAVVTMTACMCAVDTSTDSIGGSCEETSDAGRGRAALCIVRTGSLSTAIVMVGRPERSLLPSVWRGTGRERGRRRLRGSMRGVTGAIAVDDGDRSVDTVCQSLSTLLSPSLFALGLCLNVTYEETETEAFDLANLLRLLSS